MYEGMETFSELLLCTIRLACKNIATHTITATNTIILSNQFENGVCFGVVQENRDIYLCD